MLQPKHFLPFIPATLLLSGCNLFNKSATTKLHSDDPTASSHASVLAVSSNGKVKEVIVDFNNPEDKATIYVASKKSFQSGASNGSKFTYSQNLVPGADGTVSVSSPLLSSINTNDLRIVLIFQTQDPTKVKSFSFK